MEWLIIILLTLVFLPILLAIVVSFIVPFVFFEKNTLKPKDLRGRLLYISNFVFMVLFPWILMYGGVRYFYELLEGLNL